MAILDHDSSGPQPLRFSRAGQGTLLPGIPSTGLRTQPSAHKARCSPASRGLQPSLRRDRTPEDPKGIRLSGRLSQEPDQACGRGRCHDHQDIRVSTVGRGPNRDQREDPSTANRRGRLARLSLRKDPPTRPGGGRRHVPSVPASCTGGTRLPATPERIAGLVALALANCLRMGAGPCRSGGRGPGRDSRARPPLERGQPSLRATLRSNPFPNP